MTQFAWVLKEWAIAVDALLAGDLILLVRKGGIRESKPFFEVPSDRVLLFPTYEHQHSDAVRDSYKDGLADRPVPQPGDEVPLAGWADITHQIPLPGNPAIIDALHPFHIWTDNWLRERLAWKPERPAYALLLRAHRFEVPLTITYQPRYGGCRSWVHVDDFEAVPESHPVLSIATYQSLVDTLQAAIASVATISSPT